MNEFDQNIYDTIRMSDFDFAYVSSIDKEIVLCYCCNPSEENYMTCKNDTYNILKHNNYNIELYYIERPKHKHIPVVQQLFLLKR